MSLHDRRLIRIPACLITLACVSCSSGISTLPDPGTAQVVFDQLNAAILSVSGTAADNIYAVGADPGDGLGPYVLHYDGRSWKRLTTGAQGNLWWISVTMIDGAFYMAGDGGKILQFTPDNEQFEELTVPGAPMLFGVWGVTSGELWAVGGNAEDPDMGGLMTRFDGQEWTQEDMSDLFPEGMPTLYKVWGRGPADVYAVGRTGVILHFDGATWSRVPNDTQRTLFTIHGNGSQVVATGGAGEAVIEVFGEGVFTNEADDTLIQMNGVFIPPDGRGVTVGNRVSVAFHIDAGWKRQDIGIQSSRDLHGVWVDPEGGIWAVGGNLSASLDQGIVIYLGNQVVRGDVVAG